MSSTIQAGAGRPSGRTSRGRCPRGTEDRSTLVVSVEPATVQRLIARGRWITTGDGVPMVPPIGSTRATAASSV